MPLFFIQISYTSDFEEEIKFFNNHSEVKVFKEKIKGRRVVYIKEIESINEIFVKNLNLYSDRDYIDYYKILKRKLGPKINIFPKPKFSKEYFDQIRKLSEDHLDELRSDWASSPPTESELDEQYGTLKGDWEFF